MNKKMEKILKKTLVLMTSLVTFNALLPAQFIGNNSVVEAQTITGKRKKGSLALLLMGVDSGEFGREETGRSDVMMLALIDKDHSDVGLISIPRDTYTEIVGHGTQDKINHAYAFGGPEMSKASVENLFGMEIDHYVAVDMHGLQSLVNTVGGVEITPDTSFEIDGYYFEAGVPTQMDGATALAYVRERYTSGGDYARQDRQRQLIQAIVRKAFSTDGIKSLTKSYNDVKDEIETDINVLELVGVGTKMMHLDGNFNVYQLEGEGTMMDGVYYDIPLDYSLQEATSIIQERVYE